MLRAKVYINKNILDDIRIVNIKTKNKKGETKYQVETTGDSFCIYHDRTNSWAELLAKTLKEMEYRALMRMVETITEKNIKAFKQLKDL